MAGLAGTAGADCVLKAGPADILVGTLAREALSSEQVHDEAFGDAAVAQTTAEGTLGPEPPEGSASEPLA